jgi:hypothetical protein
VVPYHRASPMSAAPYIRLIYASRITPACRMDLAHQLERIAARGGARNLALGVASVLVVDAERFVQVLEGAREDVRQVYARIDADLRHRSPTVIVRAPTLRPRFAPWSLGVITPTPAETALLAISGQAPRPLIKALRFIAEAHRRDLDGQQETLRRASISG